MVDWFNMYIFFWWKRTTHPHAAIIDFGSSPYVMTGKHEEKRTRILFSPGGSRPGIARRSLESLNTEITIYFCCCVWVCWLFPFWINPTNSHDAIVTFSLYLDINVGRIHNQIPPPSRQANVEPSTESGFNLETFFLWKSFRLRTLMIIRPHAGTYNHKL